MSTRTIRGGFRMYTIIGDPHAKPDNLDKINTLFDMVEDLGNPAIFLGDTLDTKELIRGKCLNTIYRRVSTSKLHFTFIIGNHCWFNLECKEHSLETLKALKNVTIIDKPTELDGLLFLPYTHDLSQFKTWLKTAKGKTVFCHADISGFDYGNGLISEEGLELSDFKDVRKVISGHYHKHQNVGVVTYLGTPFSHSFGESNQDKYIGLYDPSEGVLELLPTPFPRHITIELDCAKYTGHHYNGVDIHRVILKGTQEQIDRVKREDGVKYIEQPSNSGKESIISEIDTPEVQFSKWATDIKGYSRDVLDLGLEVLKHV